MSADPRQVRREAARIWSALRLTDRARLSKRRRAFLDLLDSDPDAAEEKREEFFRLLATAQKRSLVPSASRIRCEFPDNLPITAKIPEIRAALKKHQVIVVCGTTGSGKTTQLPKAALLEGFGRAGWIGCTQPRRIAASALARRLSNETGCTCGHEIGYQVRFDDRTDDSTVIKFMTDGILLAETQNDPKLYQYDCIILDEVHERSLNIDFLLGYMKLLLARRPELRVIISSATLDAARIASFFGDAPVIEVGGRVFPVEDVYLEPLQDEELAESVARGVEYLLDAGEHGGILVFLPGEREIRDCADMLTGRDYPHTEILPLFGRMSAAEQERIFAPQSSNRRIVLATNVAETSITIPGIRYVVDSGLVRLSRYNPKSGIQELRIEGVSRASAMQRRGRCGREQDGVCVHLCSEETLADAAEFTPPEIQRASLAGVILQMAALKLPPIVQFPFVDPPSPQLIREGLTTLTDLHAIDDSGALTDEGRRLAELPVGPRLGRILLDGVDRGVLPEILLIAAFLSIQDPRERPFEKTKEADTAQRQFDVPESDFLSILKLWLAADEAFRVSKSQFRKFCRANYLNFRRMQEWRNLCADLLEYLQPETELESLEIELRADRSDPIHKSLMGGLPRRLACWDPEKKQYFDRTGRMFSIFPGSALAKLKKAPEWLLCFTIMETSRVFGRCCAVVEGAWLEEIAPELCSRAYDRVAWDEVSGFVFARERVFAGALPIHPGRRCHYGRVDRDAARTVFIKEALVPCRIKDPAAPWLVRSNELVRHLHTFEAKLRRSGSVVDPHALEQHFLHVLPPWMCSVSDIRKDWTRRHRSYDPKPEDIALVPPDSLPDADFPDRLEVEGESYRLEYVYDPGEEDDGITVYLPEAHMNLFPRAAAEYLVPGFLRMKLDYMFRSLTKTERKKLLPLDECTEAFLDGLKHGEIYPARNLPRVLASFLRTFRGCDFDESAFDDIELPEYLILKYAILNEHGKLLRVVRDLPEVDDSVETVSSRHAAARKWELHGETSWPDDIPELPVSVRLNHGKGREVYPGFFREQGGESVGCALFLDEAEARAAHRRAVLTLFRIRYPEMFTHMRSYAKLGRSLEHEFFPDDPDWRADLTDNAVARAIGCPPENIRDPKAFDDACLRLRNRLADAVREDVSALLQLLSAYEPIERRLGDLPADSFTDIDVNRQLAVLFRKGFLRMPDAVARYPRYLRALRVRLERADQSYGRDRAKGEAIAPFIDKFHLLYDAGVGLEECRPFFDFFLLLQEARIAAWTPELPTVQKATPATLQAALTAVPLSAVPGRKN
jgi:ATP-dependent helicase HrpA